ncbi:transcription factor with AP2 domain, putative [Babesia caballi]|uniref:Transcription factor with AP2 domain, putative n=1 Tax=Babesia caballi TaxID=5871 RepID=A0AAV4LPV0_BABCB|nr:transcription factor with AP2 domain, putative [Babesia caballi]
MYLRAIFINRIPWRLSRPAFSGTSEVAVKPASSTQVAAKTFSDDTQVAPNDRECATSQRDAELPECLTPSPGSTRLRLLHHVFRWGVGNAFRAQSKNRFRPTHAERNTAVSLREGYFSCDRQFTHCKIVYDPLNEQWEVLWNEFGKLNGKPFPVKKFGVEASKAESIRFAEQLDQRLKEQSTAGSDLSEEPGITFDHTLHCWVALGRVRGRPAARAFSADYHGYERARTRASDFRAR